MNGRKALAGGLALAGAATAATRAISRRRQQRGASRFYQHTGPRAPAVQWGTAYAGIPVVYHRSEGCQTLHTASFEAVRATLPSAELHPLRATRDRAVIAIMSYRHDEITAHGVHGKALMPYGEVVIAALVTTRPARPLLPLVAPRLTRATVGAFVLHMPVTHLPARDGGRLVWGYPKFVADMTFEDSIETQRCTLSEGGHDILTHTLHPAGRPSVLNEPVVLYSVLEGELLALEVPMSGISCRRRGSAAGRLELGDHQVAEELQELAIDPEPFMGRRLTGLHLALTLGHAVGEARQYLGYIGEDRDLGRYVVRYANEAPIDMYAPYGPSAKPLADMDIGAAAGTRPS